jgi:proton glutamate symport protein
LKTGTEAAQEVIERSPLEFFVDIVPENFFEAASDNANMLQVVFIAILLGIGIVKIPVQQGQGADQCVRVAQRCDHQDRGSGDEDGSLWGIRPDGGGDHVDLAGDDLSQAFSLLSALGWYTIAVVIGLILHVLIVYSSLFKIFSQMSLKEFLQGDSAGGTARFQYQLKCRNTSGNHGAR